MMSNYPNEVKQNPTVDEYKSVLAEYKKNIEQLENYEYRYERQDFETLFCGSPKLAIGLTLPIISVVHFNNIDYTALRHCYTNGCRVTIDAAKLPVRDLDDKQIYLASNGSLFIYNYTFPDSSDPSTESALFCSPRISFAQAITEYERNRNQAEALVNQIFSLIINNVDILGESYFYESSINKIAQLAQLAYSRGVGSKIDPNELFTDNSNQS